MRIMRGLLIIAMALTPFAVVASTLTNGLVKEVCSGTTEKNMTLTNGGCFRWSKNICLSEKVKIAGDNFRMTDTITCLCPTEASLDSVGCGPNQKSGTVEGDYIKLFKKCAKPTELEQVCPKPASKCVSVGDSLGLGVCNAGCNASGVKNACPDAGCNSNTADPNHLACGSRTTANVVKTIDSTPVDQLQDKSVFVSGGCSNNKDSSGNIDPSQCDMKSVLKSFQDKNVDLSTVYCSGISPNAPNAATINSQIQSDCEGAGAHYVGVPGNTVGTNCSADCIHPSSKGYQTMLGQIGQIEPASEPPPDTPLQQQTTQGSCSGVDGMASNIFYRESRCNTVQTNDPNSPYQGPAQYDCATWKDAVRVAGIGNPDCSYRNDPTMAAEVTNARLSKLEWDPKYGGRCPTEKGVSMSSCLDAMHLFGIGAYQKMVDAYNANPDAPPDSWCGGSTGLACTNKKILNSSGSMADLFKNIDRLGAGKGMIATDFNSNVPAPAVADRDTNIVFKDNTSLPSESVSHPSISSGSNGWGSSFNNSMLGYSLGSSLMNPFQSLFKPANASTNKSQTAAAPPPLTPTLSLTVQPTTVVRGNQITVSWTSSGMSLSAPCTVTKNGASLGSGNVGAVIVTTSATSTLGSIVFRLVCQAATNGQVYTQSSTATLQAP